MVERFVFIGIIFCVGCTTRETSGQQTAVAQIHTLDSSTSNMYSWKPQYGIANKLVNRIVVPENYERVPVKNNSFESWLRNLPLKPGNPEVKLFDGSSKFNQRAQYAVVDIDVGNRDLQQCADAVMRLRGEYLYAEKQFEKLHFNYTNGFYCDFIKWSQGYRTKVSGNNVSWALTASASDDYSTFRKYMDNIFTYCGTVSLTKELKSKALKDIEIGDVFIYGGFPGHAVLVVDVAQHLTTGERIFLLVQSYMPAQDIHLLRNPEDVSLSPWYSNILNGNLITPEWTFEPSSLKEF